MERSLHNKFYIIKIIFATLVAGIFFSSQTYSQNSEPVFRHYTPEDGLPSSQIYQVVQDRNGFLWFASDHGLAKYNGYEFKIFTSANGLTDNTVFKLFLDLKNRVWMQTFSGQLFYVENDKIISYKYNSKLIDLVKNYIPQGFYIDSLENVWFSCSYGGEYKIDPSGKTERLFSFDLTKKYNQVFLDEMDQQHYLTSGNTISNLEFPLRLYFRFQGTKYDSLYRQKNDNGQVITIRKHDGKLLVALSKYLYEFKNNNLVLLQEFPAIITQINEDKQNRLWVSTYLGLFLCDQTFSEKSKKSYLNKEVITCSIEDHEGGIWVTTLNSGVYYLSSIKIKNYFFTNDEFKEPLCLNADTKNIYAGFWNGKLLRVNSDSCETIWSFPDKSYISHIYSDTLTQKIYVAKQIPGFILNKKFTPLKGSGSRALKGNYLRRKNGDLLNATINGIYKIARDSFFALQPLSQRANCIYETEKQVLLIGCNSGVFILDDSGETHLLNPVFKNVRVDDISEMNGTLCFATRGKGLLFLYHNEIITIDESAGLCSNIIHRLSVNKNTIWCASYNGLSKITISDFNKLRYKISNVSFREGLPNNEINDILVLNDTVWVASKTAISFFNQNENFENRTPPFLHFTSLMINNVDTVFKACSQLPYSSNNISIGFEALSFKSGGTILYNYTLIHEADTFISKTNDRHVEFLSLKPGNYLFTVTAMNSSGTLSRNPIKLQFTISTPFWQQWWFRVLISLVLFIILYSIVRLRINRIKKEEALKTDFNKQLVMLEVKALRAQMNPHFIFNVINSIQDYILKNDSRSAQRYLSKFAKLVRLILDNSVEGEVLLSEELKANELYIELERQRFDEQFDFIYDIDENVDKNSIIIPSMIIQPFLENSIKHGIRHLHHKGQLILSIKQNDTHLIIVIEDNGVGRSAAGEWNKGNSHEHVSRGSVITSKRVEAYNKAHNSTIELSIIDLFDENNLPKGTRVELKIPVKYRGMKTE